VSSVKNQQSNDNLLNQAQSFYAHGNYTRATSLIKKYHKKKGVMKFEVTFLESKLYYMQGKFAQSLQHGTLAVKLARTAQEKTTSYSQTAAIYIKLMRYQQAEMQFEQSIKCDNSINNGQARLDLLNLYIALAEYDKAKAIAKKLLGWTNFFAAASILLIDMEIKTNNKKAALNRSRQLSQQWTVLSEQQLVALIECFIIIDEVIEAKKLLETSACAHNGKAWYVLFIAKIHFIENQFNKALTCLSELNIKKMSAAYNLKGKVLEKLNAYDQAFENFTISADLYQESVKDFVCPDYIMKYATTANFKQLKSSINESDNYNEQRIVFMLGFPRSGTTLLDSFLSTHDDVLVLSESRSVETILEHMIAELGINYPRELFKLSAKDKNILREKYIRFVSNSLGVTETNKTIVDKNPLHTVHIPLLKILFPNSKIIISIRHPLDVCLSCFQQAFNLNPETYMLNTLDNCVKRYKSMFVLLEKYEKELGIELLYVKYENLINNLPSEMKTVCDYINITYNTSYLEFANRDKIVTTASSHQANKAIYNTSVDKWRRYSDNLLPYKDELSPFINRFGYNVN
jgi:tetratricopeptide (TPR) repeat protein